MVLVEAMVRAGSTDPKVYGIRLFDTRLDGVTARIEFGSEGDLKRPAMTLFRFRGGKKVPLNGQF